MGKKHKNSTYHTHHRNNPSNNNSYYHPPHYPPHNGFSRYMYNGFPAYNSFPAYNGYMYPMQQVFIQPQYMMPPSPMMPPPRPPINFEPPRPKRCQYHQDIRHKNLETSIKKCNDGIESLKEEIKNINQGSNNADRESEYNESWTDALINYNQHHPHYFIDYLHPYLKKEHVNLDVPGMNMTIKGTIKTERGNELIDMYLYEPDLIAYVLHKLKVPAYLKDITLDITLTTPSIKYMLVSTANYPIATIDTMNIINSDTFDLYFDSKEKKSINKKILDEFLESYGDYTPPVIDKFVKKGIDLRTLKKYKKLYKDKPIEKEILIEGTDLDDIFNKLSGIAGKMLEGKFDNLLDEVKDTIKQLDDEESENVEEEGQNDTNLINLSFVGPTIKALTDIDNDDIEVVESSNNTEDDKTEEMDIDSKEMDTEEIPNVIIDDVSLDTNNLSDIVNNEIEESNEEIPNVIIEKITIETSQETNDEPEGNNNETTEDETTEDNTELIEENDDESIETLELPPLDEDKVETNDELVVLEPIDMSSKIKLSEEELYDKYNDIVLKHYTNGLRNKMDKKFLLIYSD